MSDEKIVPYLHPAEIEAIYGVRVSPRLCECDLMKDKLALAVEALDAANGVIDLLTAYNVGVSFLSEERVELAMEKYRAALEKLRGEK